MAIATFPPLVYASETDKDVLRRARQRGDLMRLASGIYLPLTRNDDALVATLAFARRWTARVDFASRHTAESDLERTNASRDAKEAEDAGVRLTLP